MQESVKAEGKVRPITNQLEQFQDVAEYGEHIKHKSAQDRSFIIASGQLR